MELLLLHVIILLLTMSDFSSGITYNSKSDTGKGFACAMRGYPQKDGMIKLYLSSDDLEIHCFFYSEKEGTSMEFLSVFTSGGLAPDLGIINSTYTGIFRFNLTMFRDNAYWLIRIPRENITKNTDIAAVEEWLVRITLQHGLNIYTTEGTLLDRVREPILQWKLGTPITSTYIRKVYRHVIDLKITKSPCANDVALLGLLLNSTLNGVYIGLSSSGFWNYNDTLWYDLTTMIYSQFGEEHDGLSVVDMVLTNHFLVILTSLGLFVSGDLRYPSDPVLKLSRAEFCGFERVDYIKGKLWYSERCFANREKFEVDYVSVTFERNRTLSEASSCFYTKEPFLEWLPCLPHISKGMSTVPSTVVTFLVNQDHSSVICLLNNKKETSASVHTLENSIPRLKQKYPLFMFPSSFSSPVGMVYHPRSHFLYAYGNQVWLSVDGGNTFEFLADFHDDVIQHTYHSFYTSDIILVSQRGKVYLTKAGLERYSEIGSIADKIFTLYFDHMGFIHKVTPYHFKAGRPQAESGNPDNVFGQVPDMGFDTALAPQHITTNQMVFYAYVPENEPKENIYKKQFNSIHFGKVLHSRKVGNAEIKQVLQHNAPKGFSSAVIAEVIEPFGIEEVIDSPSLSSSLSINQDGNFYKLTLQTLTPGAFSLFQKWDLEKTVVIPGYSSFLITSIVDDKNALAIATMPKVVPKNMTFSKDSWFLYNLGQKIGRMWAIYEKPCNYWFQQQDDSLSLSVLKYVDLGQSQSIKVKAIPNIKGVQTLGMPLLKVLIGNPNLLEIKATGSFDYTYSYIMEITITSKTVNQGSTSLAFIIWEASTDCFVTTLVATLKSSCSYLKRMRHIPHKFIPLEGWITGIHKDSHGFNMIKTLPVNYRPPSNMGVAIPLTDNFYHADPSKTIPRNLFHKSQKSGKFKQCANVSTREECNCTNDQKFSHSVAFSDCKEKVPRFRFPVTHYPISLKIQSEDGQIPLETPYLVTVMEINRRDNWELKHTVPENVKKLKTYLESILGAAVYNPSGLNLSVKKNMVYAQSHEGVGIFNATAIGSELFHFRVSIIPGVTFCNFIEEFQIYIDEVPLPFPGHTLIAMTTAVVLGGLIFVAFMFQIRNMHLKAKSQTVIRRSQVNLSNVNATQLAYQ